MKKGKSTVVLNHEQTKCYSDSKCRTLRSLAMITTTSYRVQQY